MNRERFGAAQAPELGGHQMRLLARARVLAHTFDPLSVFWAIAPDGSLIIGSLVRQSANA